MPMNIGTNRSTGIEINGKIDATKWLSFNGDFNYNYFNRQGSLEATSFDFNADQWSSKLTAKLKLPAEIEFEIIGQYQSQLQTEGSLKFHSLTPSLPHTIPVSVRPPGTADRTPACRWPCT